MTAILKVDTIQDTAGNNIINENANTVTIGKAGDTVNVVGTLQNNSAALVTGKVLQVVSNSSSTTISTSGTTDTEVINTSITPSSTSSKILAIASLSISVTAGTNAYAGSKLRRGTNTGTIISEKAIGDSAGSDIIGFIEHTILDSPSTTSSQQYTMSFRKASSNTTSVTTDARVYNIILMEIGA